MKKQPTSKDKRTQHSSLHARRHAYRNPPERAISIWESLSKKWFRGAGMDEAEPHSVPPRRPRSVQGPFAAGPRLPH